MPGDFLGWKFVAPGDAVLAVAVCTGGFCGAVFFAGFAVVCGFGAGGADHVRDDTGQGRVSWGTNSLLIMGRFAAALRVHKE